VVLVAAAVFLILQWDFQTMRCEFSVYGAPRNAPTLYVMLLSAAGGLLLYGCIRLVIHGTVLLRRAHRTARPPAAGGGHGVA